VGAYHDCPSELQTQFGEVAEAWMELDESAWNLLFSLSGDTPVTVASGLPCEFPLRLSELDGVLRIAYTDLSGDDVEYSSDDAGENWTGP
jgi:hypothetical protein